MYDIEMAVGLMLDSEAWEVSQLTECVRQFNMTGIPMSEGDIRKQHEVHVLRVKNDLFLSGAILIRYLVGLDTAIITNFLVSHSVMGQNIEGAFLTEVLKDLSIRRTMVVAEFVPTEKNEPAEGFYEAFGFSHTSVDGNVWLGLDLRRWKDIGNGYSN